MLNELHQKVTVRNETKLKMFAKLKTDEKKDKLKKLHEKTKRGIKSQIQITIYYYYYYYL